MCGFRLFLLGEEKTTVGLFLFRNFFQSHGVNVGAFPFGAENADSVVSGLQPEQEAAYTDAFVGAGGNVERKSLSVVGTA